MKRFLVAASICVFAAASAAAQTAGATPVAAKMGQMVHDADDGRLGDVDRIMTDGSVQIIFDTKVVTIPASTLSISNDELRTSLTKNQVRDLKS